MLGLTFRTESFRKGIVLSTAFSVGAKAIAFFVNPMIAFYFGAGVRTDVYFFCLSSSVVIAGFLVSLNSTVVIPHSTHLLAQRDTETSQGFLNFFLYAYCAIALAVAAIGVLAPVSALATISRFPSEVLKDNAMLIRCFAGVLWLMTVSSLLSDILFSYRYFTIPMICSGSTSALALVLLIIFHKTLGTLCVPIAMLIGQAFQIILLWAFMKRALRWRFRCVRFKEVSQIWKDLAVSYLGNASSSLNSYLPAFLLSGFGAGTLTALSYAQSAASIPTVLVMTQSSSVAGIKFNELCAKRDYSNVNRVFVAAAAFLHFLLIPAACIMALLRREIIVVLFHRGMTSTGAVALTAAFLAILAFQIPLNVINTLSARLFMADRQIAFSVWYQIVFSAVLFVSIWGMVVWIGPLGYPTATVVLYSLNLIALIWILGWRFPFLQYRSVLWSGAKLVLANASLAALAWWTLGRVSHVSPMTRVGLVVSGYALLLGFLNDRLSLNAEAAQYVRAAGVATSDWVARAFALKA